MQVIIDERADASQREALRKIIHGEDTKEMATMWWVFSAMSPNKLETLYKPIDFQVDVSKRKRRMSIPGIIEMAGEPIRNPVTGAEHRVRIDLPDGTIFDVANPPFSRSFKSRFQRFFLYGLANGGYYSSEFCSEAAE